MAPFDQVGTLNVSWQPVFTNDDTEEQPVVTDPMTELVGRPWSARVEIKVKSTELSLVEMNIQHNPFVRPTLVCVSVEHSH